MIFKYNSYYFSDEFTYTVNNLFNKINLLLLKMCLIVFFDN